MDRIVFADSWERYFAQLGLKNFDDFYDYVDTTEVNKNQRRNVQQLSFCGDTDCHTFFMKRFQNPRLKDMLAARRMCGSRASQAGVEWHNARHLLANHITTYEPVCMGERTRWGVERNSLFVTRELEAICLRDFVVDNWRNLERYQQENILIAVGKLVRTLRKLDIAFPDLYTWHLFLHDNNLSDNSQLSIIDLHRMRVGIRSQRRKTHNLSRLCWSMVPDYFDEDHKQLLLNTCLEEFSPSQREGLKSVVKRYEATLNRRRTAHRYYRKTPQFISA